MANVSDLINQDGVKFNVTLDRNDLLFAGLVFFGAAVFAGLVIIFTNRVVNPRNK